MKWFRKFEQPVEPPEPEPLTTDDRNFYAWANQRFGGGAELPHVEKSLRELQLDHHLTEEEVILAAVAIKREAFSVSPGTVASMMALVVAILAGIATAWSTWGFLWAVVSGTILLLLGVPAALFCLRALIGMGSPVGVQAIVEDRRSKGTLRRLPPDEG